MAGAIVIKGARVHNLKNIDLEIPRDRFVVVTGVSGSGKSSLAFDTLYAEGRRRYLESLGPDARPWLRQLDKPDVDAIEGLSPTIAIQPTTAWTHPRSTVGTLTDTYDLLRLLFARVGEPFCLECGAPIRAYAIEQIIEQALALPTQSRILVLAPLGPSPAAAADRLRELARQGFSRILIDGEMHELDSFRIDAERAPRLDLVIDRLVLREGVERRLADSLEIASRHGNGVIKVRVLGASESEPAREMLYSQNWACPRCGTLAPELTPSLFSFNSPQGACPACKGIGIASEQPGRRVSTLRLGEAEPCPVCRGTRLKRESRAVRIGGRDICPIAALSIGETVAWLENVPIAEDRRVIGERIVEEIISRLRCMVQLGLDYLSLDRRSETLSGGELQRARLATQIGSPLAGVLYVLDEPSIGLHQKDTAQLVAVLKRLRDLGNSVIVVEHDPETMLAADHIIDMGPGAGTQGGEVVAQGAPSDIVRSGRSVTGRYLSGDLEIPISAQRRSGSGKFLTIRSARARNLKGITAGFPVGAMTCVTGVSGAGKSTLVMELLYRSVTQKMQRFGSGDTAYAGIDGWENFDRIIAVDQSAIGRTPRSNPATYTGIYDHLRELFAQLPEARVRGYGADRFSFNLRGGRCEACLGDGVTRVEMQFIPDLFVTCAVCQGRRYNRETLQIRYKGLSIADVLDLTVGQALELFGSIPPVYDRLRMLHDVGLGYVRLGQSGTTLSGGEAQRVKLARELGRRSNGKSLYLFDEPTTGLHFDDVKKLLEVLHRLTDLGNTLVVVEHNLDMIRSADYVVELGPGSGPAGGQIVARGTPEEIAGTPGSATGTYLLKSAQGWFPR